MLGLHSIENKTIVIPPPRILQHWFNIEYKNKDLKEYRVHKKQTLQGIIENSRMIHRASKTQGQS